jgi:hypothetical protein
MNFIYISLIIIIFIILIFLLSKKKIIESFRKGDPPPSPCPNGQVLVGKSCQPCLYFYESGYCDRG